MEGIAKVIAVVQHNTQRNNRVSGTLNFDGTSQRGQHMKMLVN
jgi:hypothetical protein